MFRAYLEPVEVEQLEQAAEYLRDKLLIRLLFRLGCRISEALGLSPGDIDFNGGTVTIEHLKTRIKLSCPHCQARLGRTHQFCPKCGLEIKEALAQEREHHRRRAIPVDGETLAMLDDYVKRGGAISCNGKRLLFGINRHRAWQIVRECAERAGLPRLINSETGKDHGVSPHRLRDAFAVNAVRKDDSGDGLRLLQEMLGHQSITTTFKYRKVAGEELREWYEKLWEGGSHNG